MAIFSWFSQSNRQLTINPCGQTLTITTESPVCIMYPQVPRKCSAVDTRVFINQRFVSKMN